ncbi:MAG TPA: hypothetical protein VFQ35_18655 [Polyangiaceae bacterium]|nr:hypothetical protein [Polyangiaceae bacterium]
MSSRFTPFRWLVRSWLLSYLAIPACAPHKAPQGARCTLKYAVTTRELEVRPTDAPYEAPLVLVGERFGFKAVLRDGERASLNLYVYDREHDTLLQEVKYTAPFPGSRADAEFGFTGHQYVYSSSGREFEYWCRWSSP